MAEDNQEEGKRTKRRLKVNTETVRERTEKFQQKEATPRKPSQIGTFFAGFFWPLRFLGRQIAKLGRFRFFRWLSYILLPPYIRNSWRELRLVTWPDRRQTFRLTYAVIVFSVMFGIIVAVVDFVLNKIFKEIILR